MGGHGVHQHGEGAPHEVAGPDDHPRVRDPAEEGLRLGAEVHHHVVHAGVGEDPGAEQRHHHGGLGAVQRDGEVRAVVADAGGGNIHCRHAAVLLQLYSGQWTSE